MTVKEKYLRMNKAYIDLYNAIFDPSVDNEHPEPKLTEQTVDAALDAILIYLDFYKKLNNITI